MACCAFAIVLLSAVLGAWDNFRARLNWLLGEAPPKANQTVAWELGMVEPTAKSSSVLRKPLVRVGLATVAVASLSFLIFHDHAAHARDDQAGIFNNICIGIENAIASVAAEFSNRRSVK